MASVFEGPSDSMICVISPWLYLQASSLAICWGHSVVCFKVDEFGSFHWKTAVLPKFRQRESGRGKSRCISSFSISDQGVEIWGRTAAPSASRTGSSGAPERVQSHFGTRRVPSSIRDMPVWGMLNRFAE